MYILSLDSGQLAAGSTGLGWAGLDWAGVMCGTTVFWHWVLGALGVWLVLGSVGGWEEDAHTHAWEYMVTRT